jgi:enoyl-[acyl-carrier protein] reductase I
MADVPDEVKNDRRYAKFAEYSVQGTIDAVGKEFGGIDILIQSVAFSREITKPLIETSRKAYHEAMGISAYSLTSLVRAAAPHMANRPGGASVVGLTYVAGERVVPHYGGGMGTCKAALQIDAKQLSWFVGDKNVRVNLISAGPYASRAARSIRPGEFEKSVEYAEIPIASWYALRLVSISGLVTSRPNAIEWIRMSMPPNSLPTASTVP